LLALERLDTGVVADEVEKRINGFAHQPAIRIRDTATGAIPYATPGDNIAGAAHDGAIYLGCAADYASWVIPAVLGQ
jgi:hypothetical protein